MKNAIILLVIILSACSISKDNTSTNTVISPAPLDVTLTLNEKPFSYIWKKGTVLHLNGMISNNSKDTIIIIAPKNHRDQAPDLFQVNISDSFTGTSCIYEVGENEYINREGFWKIPPMSDKPFYIRGEHYLLDYCNTESASMDSIEVVVTYYGKAYDLTKDSPFISRNYKAELSDEEQSRISERIVAQVNSRYKDSISLEEKAEKIALLERSYIRQRLKYTPDEQKEIISLFNRSVPHKLKSNTISIAIEK